MQNIAVGLVALAILSMVQAVRAETQLGTDQRLVDAGFVMRRADTPDKLARARALPQRKFVSRTHRGQRYYLYAELEVCKCVFVGDARALQSFRTMLTSVQQPDDVSANYDTVADDMIR